MSRGLIGGINITKTRFDTKGIKSLLNKLQFSENNFYKSIAEFIWNGFDAKASIVELSYEIYQNKNEGQFRELIIKELYHQHSKHQKSYLHYTVSCANMYLLMPLHQVDPKL